MPFAFWPLSPVVSPTWLEFLDFASTRADGTWLFRGHADSSWELIPAIGRQASASGYRASDEKILFDDFISEARRYLDEDDFTDLEWLAVALHHGLPTRLLEWSTNPLVAALFAVENEAVSSDAEIWAIRVPLLERLRDVAVFGSRNGAPVIVDVPPRAARITGQQGCFSLHSDPPVPWQPSTRKHGVSTITVPAAEKADFRRLLHIFGYDARTRRGNLDGLGNMLAWRYRQR